jgi:hypothetical protein
MPRRRTALEDLDDDHATACVYRKPYPGLLNDRIG